MPECDIVNLVIDEDKKKTIEDLSKLLNIRGTDMEKYNTLKQLSQKENFDWEETNTCLVNLQQIIFTLRACYEENDDKMLGKNIYTNYVLSTMNEINKKRRLDYDGKIGENALKLFRSKENEEHQKEIAEGFSEIFDSFCFPEKEVYDINDRWQCIRVELDRIVKVHEDIAVRQQEFFERLNKLDGELKEILLKYIRYAPKKLGNNLQRVMDKQRLSENDILKFVNQTLSQGEKSKKISTIQGLINTDTSKDKETIRCICRALLISEDVLYRGTGKIYGNLGELLSEDGITDIREIAKEKNIKEVNDKQSDKAIQKYIKNGMKDIIINNNMDLKQLTEEYPELFREENYQLYDDNECFAYLLHQEDAIALLEVLERLRE